MQCQKGRPRSCQDHKKGHKTMAVDEVCASFCAQVSSLTPTLKLPSKNKAKHILYNIHIKWAEVEFQQILIRTRVIHAKKGVNTSNLGSLFGMLDGRKMFLDCDIFWSADNIIVTQNRWFHHHLAQRHSSRPSLANWISQMSSVKNFSFGLWQLQHLKLMSNSLDLKKPTEAVRSTNDDTLEGPNKCSHCILHPTEKIV